MATGRAASKARAEKRKSVPVSSKSSGLSASQAANEKAAQNIRFGIKSGETVNYVETERQKDGSYKSNGRSTREKAIRADQIGDMTSPVIPEPPRPDNVGDLLGMNNASVLQEGLTLQGGQFVPDPTASDQMNATKQYNANVGNIANAMLSYIKPEANQGEKAYEDVYGISSREAGRDLRDAERARNQYTAQLNTLTANRDAEMLKLEGQGRGQTSGFIGGEQARINREAAIQALPIQAQLAAAQADYETAKSHVDTLFQLKLKDIDTMQAYKTTVANTFMSVATAQQQNLLNAAIADSNAKAEAKKIAMNDAKTIAMQAIEYGQSSLARSVMSLDPTSPTYQEDVLKMMGQLSKPVAASNLDTSFDKFGNLINMQTGDVIRYADDGTGGSGNIMLADGSMATSDEMAYARQYAATGTIPAGLSSSGVSFGRIAEIAADMPKTKGTLVSKDTGVAPDGISATEQTAYENLYNAVNTDLPRMLAAWDKMNSSSNFGGTGIVGGIASTLNPSEANTRFESAKAEFLSKLLVARSGAAVTEQEYERYARQIPGKFNTPFGLGTSGTDKLNNLNTQMNSALNDKLAVKGLSIYGYSQVNLDGQPYTVGDIITNEYGAQGRVNPDGTITVMNQ